MSRLRKSRSARASKSRATSASRPLTVESIADAALRLIDREGLDALSMRRLGAELGVEAMAIYHHLPDKEALIDAVVARGTPGSLPLPTGDWRRDLSALMGALYAQLSAHPALFPLRWSRRAAGAEAKAILDREQEIFKAARFSEALTQDAHRLLGSYVVGSIVVGAEAHREVSREAWLAQFRTGLDILLDGIEVRHRRESPAVRRRR